MKDNNGLSYLYPTALPPGSTFEACEGLWCTSPVGWSKVADDGGAGCLPKTVVTGSVLHQEEEEEEEEDPFEGLMDSDDSNELWPMDR